MSTMSTFQPFTSSFYKTNHFKPFTSPINHSFALYFQKNANFTHNSRHFRLTHNSKLRRVKSTEEGAQIPETAAAVVEEEASTEPAETVAIPVYPSDKLLMFFQAEGTLSDSGIPKVTQALEETDGVSNLKVHISEGIASVELTKQTIIQATGVASSLLETIQGAGFKLQTLNLSFEDEELLVGV